MQAQSDAAHALGTCLSLLMQSSQIIENNSHVTPVRIIRKDGEFYTIQFADCIIRKRKHRKRSGRPPPQTDRLLEMVIIRHPTSTITAEVHMASDISTGERNTTMNQEKYDDEFLRSVQEGLEKMLEELLKEEK